MWKYTGKERPDFADEPGPGQESVWDYPRPPVLEPFSRTVEVRVGKRCLARSDCGFRLKETASPPTWYIPASSVDWDLLERDQSRSLCEWKGTARYWALAGKPGQPVAWAYPDVSADFRVLSDHVSFFPGRVACFVDGERVRPQAGGFYGGWVTDDIVGPCKGDPGTGHW